MKITCRVCERATDAFLCANPCAADLERAFAELPGLVGDVIDSLARQTRVYRSARRPGTVDEDWRGGDEALEGHPLPVDFDAGALLARVENTVTTWARHLAEARGLHLPAEQTDEIVTVDVHVTVVRNRWRIVREPRLVRAARRRTLADLTRWMLANRNAIRYDEAAADLHADITRLRDDLRRFVDRSPSPFFAGPCQARTGEDDRSVLVPGPKNTERKITLVARGQCERDLYAWINPFRIDPGGKDRPTVTCNGYRSPEPGDHGCGTVHTLADRDEWLLASVDDALLPLATWQAALPRLFPGLTWPNRTTWWRWVANEDETKRRLFAKSIDRDAVELFRGGDIVELVRGEQARIRGKSGKTSRMAS